MLILVAGKNGSGKSKFAEDLAVGLRENRYYIATMIPNGDEGAARVQKHIARREGQCFTTLELPCAVGGADIPADAVVLLEDVSNLMGNAMFERGLSETEVLADIRALCRRVECVIAVTISGFDDGDYSEETLRYIRALDWLNGQLELSAEVSVEMRNGTPVFRKDETIV